MCAFVACSAMQGHTFMDTESVSATTPACSYVNLSRDRVTTVGPAITETEFLSAPLPFLFLSSTFGFIFNPD